MKVLVLTKMHRGKHRTKIISKLDSHLKIYFDAEAHLYHFTLQTVYVDLGHLKVFKK